jgi:hypothetical protein
MTAAVSSFFLKFTELNKSKLLKISFQISSILYIISAFVYSLKLPPIWSLSVCAAAVGLFWGISYKENQPFAVLAGNFSVFILFKFLLDILKWDVQWRFFYQTIISAAVFYIIYVIFAFIIPKKDKIREILCLSSTWFALLFSIFAGFYLNHKASAAVIIVGAITIAIHGFFILNKNKIFLETSIYLATFALQWLVNLYFPDFNAISIFNLHFSEFKNVLFAHWWAFVIFLATYIFYKNEKIQSNTRLIISASILTLGVGTKALKISETAYPILFLTEQIGILTAGALKRKKWAIIWGVFGATAAVFYFLKDYTYLWLGFLGLILITLVIWRLYKTNKKT